MGSNATVDVAHALSVTSNATIHNPGPAADPDPTFQPAFTWSTANGATGTDQIAQQYTDANAVAGAVAAAFDP